MTGGQTDRRPGSERERAALDYAARGWAVVPCHTACNGKCSCGKNESEHRTGFGKHPRTVHGFKNASTDPETIREWWAKWPDANVGINCRLSGLVVLDVDRHEAGADGFESLKELRAETGANTFDTLQVATGGGGEHFYFSAPAHPIRNSPLLPGIDVIVNGGVIAPPSVHPSGSKYRWLSTPETPLAPFSAELAPRPRAARGMVESPNGDGIPTGARNKRLTSIAGALRRRGLGERAIATVLLDANRTRCNPPLSQAEVEGIAHSVARYDPTEPSETLNDSGNADRFVEQWGADVCWCDPLARFFIWDGRRWVLDDTGRAMNLAKMTARLIYEEARKQPNDRVQRMAAWARASGNVAKIHGMLDLTNPTLAVSPSDFDRDPMLLNCLNGTLDLRTGQLREFRREDMITKMVPVAHTPDADRTQLNRFLSDATGGDTEFAKYLQRVAGYSLTGLTDEEVFFFLLGPANSGKSTLVEAPLETLGDYGVKASFATFEEHHHAGGARPDLVPFRGARLVVAVEPSGKRALDAPLIKELVSGESFTVRDIYGRPFTFKPSCKLWLAANDCPPADDQDTGLWRRLRKVPFEHVVPLDKRDPKVKKYLTTDGRTAVLAWAVEGWLVRQKDGRLGTCPAVETATSQLRASFDPMAEFTRLDCVLDAGVRTEAKVLRKAYESSARDNAARPISNKEWGDRLRNLGCEQRRETACGEKVTFWVGIRLRCAEDTPEMGDSDAGLPS